MSEFGHLSETFRQATARDLREVLENHARYWGERDLRSLHLPALVHEFPETSLVAVADDGIRGYLLGFVTPARVAYVHLIATRDDTRGTGLGRRLYAEFAAAAGEQGAAQLKAITSPGNSGSIAFHRSLGFEVRLVEDYNGPEQARIVFTRELRQPL
ncbi:GNAT family N-acetyltransferase [Nocardia sp. CDC160]|uniref:GNAT family N-acetyltransferase n=1 Tax=Nocardia sp. CDC160 TaxID=3112166 RepID=UPI002DB850CD|nr:GNAT family N-acetyltransferase [Nocardia sp. CDC160]MEC3915504.1 GNAT family N-acetyltransferase [Nocardia sp. CDC160]